VTCDVSPMLRYHALKLLGVCWPKRKQGELDGGFIIATGDEMHKVEKLHYSSISTSQGKTVLSQPPAPYLSCLSTRQNLMRAMMKTLGYQRVNANGDVDGDGLQVDEHIDGGIITRKHQSLNRRSILVGIVLGFVMSFAVFVITAMEPKDKCTRTMSIWSPALEIYNDNELSIQRFHGALRKPNEFRGPPSQDIDDSWEEITYSQGSLVRLSKAQLDRINASEFAAEYTEEMGGGYIAGIEAFHQLHCLNMLRQATYMDYYLPKNEEWRKDPETMRYHLGQSPKLEQDLSDAN
jgi:Mycotoxin biosynthesis protein UstYa